MCVLYLFYAALFDAVADACFSDNNAALDIQIRDLVRHLANSISYLHDLVLLKRVFSGSAY